MRECQEPPEIDFYHAFIELGFHPFFPLSAFRQMCGNVIGLGAFPLNTVLYLSLQSSPQITCR